MAVTSARGCVWFKQTEVGSCTLQTVPHLTNAYILPMLLKKIFVFPVSWPSRLIEILILTILSDNNKALHYECFSAPMLLILPRYYVFLGILLSNTHNLQFFLRSDWPTSMFTQNRIIRTSLQKELTTVARKSTAGGLAWQCVTQIYWRTISITGWFLRNQHSVPGTGKIFLLSEMYRPALSSTNFQFKA